MLKKHLTMADRPMSGMTFPLWTDPAVSNTVSLLSFVGEMLY